MAGNVMSVTDVDYEREVLQSKTPVVADFYAEWCGPCTMMAPLMDALAAKYAGQVKFVKVNVEAASSVAGGYGISSVPTLLFIRDGRPVDAMIGLGSLAAIEAKVRALAAAPAPAL